MVQGCYLSYFRTLLLFHLLILVYFLLLLLFNSDFNFLIQSRISYMSTFYFTSLINTTTSQNTTSVASHIFIFWNLWQMLMGNSLLRCTSSDCAYRFLIIEKIWFLFIDLLIGFYLEYLLYNSLIEYLFFLSFHNLHS